MPQRVGPIPTYRERSALQALWGAGWLPAAQLYPAGASTIFIMLGKGWIERNPDGAGGWKYRITPLGETAFKALIPGRPSRSKKSKK
jgi:hypothetical protein